MQMNKDVLITLEIFLAVVSPLLFLYLRSHSPLRTTIFCLFVIPILWYLSYALLHELAHVAGAYLVGGKVVGYKLIPRFWAGELGRAWITPEGLTQIWQQMVCTTFPYVLNVMCIVVGLVILDRRRFDNPLLVGLLFMLLVLRPAFDFLSELTGLLSVNRGDYDAIERVIGRSLTWLYILFSLVLSSVSIIIILRRFAGFTEPEGTHNGK